MTITSFTAMFGRLPIYTRPKEPAIGYPVLTESTNTNLTGHIMGLDGKPIPTPVIGGGSYNVGHKIASFKGLPDIPLMTSMHDDDDDDEEDFRPPPPLRINTLAYPSSSSSSSVSAKSEKSVNTMNTFRTPTSQRGNVQRKPAPALANHPAFSLSAKSSSETIRNHPAYAIPEPERNPNRLRGFGLGNVVKEKVASRRKQLDTSPTIAPLGSSLPLAVVKPPNFVSIDDWLDAREREGLHQRSNTVTTMASQATRYGEPLKLHLRQSTFAPLPTSHELAPKNVPVLPPIPKQYAQVAPKVSTASPPPPFQPLRTSPPPPSPPQTLPREEQVQRSHMEQLEYEQDQLVIRKSNIKREMWDLQQLLPPNPSTHNPGAREDMKKRLAELVQDLADVEKEVHENGMKLHRAWRRRDKKVGFEPTHLWVSRVNGGD